jgi:hypothetical protein
VATAYLSVSRSRRAETKAVPAGQGLEPVRTADPAPGGPAPGGPATRGPATRGPAPDVPTPDVALPGREGPDTPGLIRPA